eukprot:1757127-Rhodomonas_salina.1
MHVTKRGNSGIGGTEVGHSAMRASEHGCMVRSVVLSKGMAGAGVGGSSGVGDEFAESLSRRAATGLSCVCVCAREQRERERESRGVC